MRLNPIYTRNPTITPPDGRRAGFSPPQQLLHLHLMRLKPIMAEAQQSRHLAGVGRAIRRLMDVGRASARRNN
ncbi:hypothetical protein HMPREF9080_02414, partial [Cardiobacterium valvarum F0432]